MDAPGNAAHHAPVGVLTRIKRLDDCFGDFLVRVVCECGACREIWRPVVSVMQICAAARISRTSPMRTKCGPRRRASCQPALSDVSVQKYAARVGVTHGSSRRGAQ